MPFEGEVIEIKITDMGTKGDGIGKVQGFVIIVKGSKVGQTVKAKIIKEKTTFCIAEIEEVLSP